MDKTRSEQKNVLNRLKRAEGQIRGVQKMIEEEKECILKNKHRSWNKRFR